MQRATAQLLEIETACQVQMKGVDFRVLKSLVEAVEQLRNVASIVQEWQELQAEGKTPIQSWMRLTARAFEKQLTSWGSYPLISIHSRSNAHALSNIPRSAIQELYYAADFSVCPSRYDAFPFAVTEALACGTPVLSGLNGSSYQFLQEEPLNRLVILDPDNITAYISAAKEIAPRPEYYKQAVLTQAKSAVEQWMKPENHWKRFGEITKL